MSGKQFPPSWAWGHLELTCSRLAVLATLPLFQWGHGYLEKAILCVPERPGSAVFLSCHAGSWSFIVSWSVSFRHQDLSCRSGLGFFFSNHFSIHRLHMMPLHIQWQFNNSALYPVTWWLKHSLSHLSVPSITGAHICLKHLWGCCDMISHLGLTDKSLQWLLIASQWPPDSWWHVPGSRAVSSTRLQCVSGCILNISTSHFFILCRRRKYK